MKAEIIGVGTELLMGQIANTDAQFLSQQLSELGIDVFYHHVVGDNIGRLVELIKKVVQRSDILITTGGLGQHRTTSQKTVWQRRLGSR